MSQRFRPTNQGLLLFVPAALLAIAADWPQFRGPDGLGIAPDKGLPVTWSADRNVVWKTELPGPGSSNPIVVGTKIFLTCFNGYGLDAKDPGHLDLKNPGNLKDLKRHLVCLDRAGGKVLWTRTVAAVLPEAGLNGQLGLHGYATSTPVSDGTHVYVFFGKSGVFAFDLNGAQLWQASVGTKAEGYGSAASPVLYKDFVIVNAAVESGAVVALDKNTGKETWRAPDLSGTYGTPMLVKVPKGGTELVISAGKQVLGFDPDTGKEWWHADYNAHPFYACPSVIAHEGVVYAFAQTRVAVRAGGRGDVTQSHILWQKGGWGGIASPVYYEGHLYCSRYTGAEIIKADDGTIVYSDRLPSSNENYASQVLADGKVYYVSRTKGAYVIEANPKFKLLAHNTLEPDTSVFNAGPAVSNGQLLLRSDRYLYCIGKKE